MPTEPGFYWCRNKLGGAAEVVFVEIYKHGPGPGLAYKTAYSGAFELYEFTDWIGPLSYPQPRFIDTTHCNN